MLKNHQDFQVEKANETNVLDHSGHTTNIVKIVEV